MTFADYLKLVATLFAVVNPLSVIPLFLSFTDNQKRDRTHVAKVASMSAGVIMVISVFFGTYILSFFGLSMDGFRIAGGFLLLIIAVNMFFPKDNRDRQTDEERQEAVESRSVAVVPLAMPLLAGPGTISTIILLSSRYEGVGEKATIASACLILSLIIWLSLLAAPQISRRIGTIGMNVVTRIMGLVLASLAMDFMVAGMQHVFPGLL